MNVGGRADAAKERARTVISSLTAGERVGIVAFASDAVLLSPVTMDKGELSDAIDRYRPASGAANYAEGFKAAEMMLAKEPQDDLSIDLISDFQESGLNDWHRGEHDYGSVDRAKVTTHPVGSQVERNAFLIDEEIIAGESANEIAASELINSSEGQSGARRKWVIDSRDGEKMELRWRTEPNGQITARIRTVAPDEFDADDEKYIAFMSPRKGRALLVEPSDDDAAPFLRAALEATQTDLGEKRFLLERKSVLPQTAAELTDYSLVAINLHGAPRSNELQTLLEYARGGGVVWLCLANDVDTTQWNQFANTEDGRAYPFTAIERRTDASQAKGFGSVDPDAPALRALNKEVFPSLLSVRMQGGFEVTPRADATILIRWSDATPAFVSVDAGLGSILLFATSPARSSGDLGTSSIFPALASSIARFAIEQRDPVAREIGQPVFLKLPLDASVKIIDANGKVTSPRASDLVRHPASYFPSPGIYRIETDTFTKYLAFNSPRSESEVGLMGPDKIEEVFKTKSTTAKDTSTSWLESAERQRSVWRFFLFIAFVLLIAELFIAMKQNQTAKAEVE
jgi:hypothetical protein